MKKVFVIILMGLALACTSSVQAGPGCGHHHGDKSLAASSTGADAVIAQLEKSMPKMEYRVGTYHTACSKMAGEKAKQSGAAMSYVVGDETFHCPDKAQSKLASLIEAEVDKLSKVQYEAGGECYECPFMASSVAKSKGQNVRYRLAGFTFNSEEKARQAAAAAASAVAKFNGGEMQVASATTGSCCGKCGGKDKAGCSKSCSKAQTASAKTGSCCGKCGGKDKAGCSKSCSKAQTASAKTSSCCGKCGGKDKAGCSKSCSKAQTASATTGSCCGKCGGKDKAGCSKSCSKAQTASATTGCSKSCAGKAAGACCPSGRIAQAQQKMRVIVTAAATVYQS
jgi:hypothetical protein